MEKDKVLLTQDGLDNLKKERENLINFERPKVIEELSLARSQGDLSENADYDAARNRQAEVEGRIKEIERLIQNAQVIDEDNMDSHIAGPGATVTFKDLSDNQMYTYKIVGSFETDPFKGKISNESPLAKALFGRGEGERITVGVANPYEIDIVKIDFLH